MTQDINMVSSRVELVTVNEDLLNILFEIVGTAVASFLELISYSREIHWLLDDREVVRNIEGNWIDWYTERARDSCVFGLLHFNQDLFTKLEFSGKLLALGSD